MRIKIFYFKNLNRKDYESSVNRETMTKFDKNDLLHRIKTFIGYGNLNARFWFIGYEEGCSENRKDIEFRLKVPGIQDIYEAHKELKKKILYEKNRDNPLIWFEEEKFQKTWGALIKILLIAKGEFEQGIDTGTLSDSELKEKAIFYQSNQ